MERGAGHDELVAESLEVGELDQKVKYHQVHKELDDLCAALNKVSRGEPLTTDYEVYAVILDYIYRFPLEDYREANNRTAAHGSKVGYRPHRGFWGQPIELG